MEDPDTAAVQVDRWRGPAEWLRLVAHPVRLMILASLCEKPRCVKDLNNLVPIVQPHLSQHMAALRQARLVDFYSSGTLRCYYIIRPSLVQSLVALLRKDHPEQKRERRWVLGQSKGAGQRTRKRGGRPVKKDLSPAVNPKRGGR